MTAKITTAATGGTLQEKQELMFFYSEETEIQETKRKRPCGPWPGLRQQKGA